MLDIAAGHGLVTEALMKKVFDVSCCDIDPAHCRRRGISCAEVDLNRQPLPYPDSLFDYIVF